MKKRFFKMEIYTQNRHDAQHLYKKRVDSGNTIIVCCNPTNIGKNNKNKVTLRKILRKCEEGAFQDYFC